MEWLAILAHYRRIFDERGFTQEGVAARGGLEQSDISRIFKNTRRGPSVQVFVRAVEGLGMTLSAFFADLDAAAVAQDHDTAPLSAASAPGKTRARLTPRLREATNHGPVVVSDLSPHMLEICQALNRLLGTESVKRALDQVVDDATGRTTVVQAGTRDRSAPRAPAQSGTGASVRRRSR